MLSRDERAFVFFFSSRRRHTRLQGDWSSDVCSSDLFQRAVPAYRFAPFERNHDQTRTMAALGNDTAGARIAATILLTLPGVPFIYRSEERRVGKEGRSRWSPYH